MEHKVKYKMSLPLVSICIPTFNGEKFISEAMDSAISQTYRPLEIIVSDDDSKDKTLEIITTYKNKTDIPIHIFHHKPEGIGANWNNCVSHSNGEYIKFLFQDDLLEVNCVEKMVDAIIADKNIGLVFSKRKILYDKESKIHLKWIDINGDLQKNMEHILPIQDGKIFLKDPKLLNSPRNKIGEPVAVLLNKKVFEKVGYFSTDLKQTLDYEYWYRIFKHYNVCFLNEQLVSFRLHNQQATAFNILNSINETKLIERILFRNYFKYLHPVSIFIIIKKHLLLNRWILYFKFKLKSA